MRFSQSRCEMQCVVRPVAGRVAGSILVMTLAYFYQIKRWIDVGAEIFLPATIRPLPAAGLMALIV